MNVIFYKVPRIGVMLRPLPRPKIETRTVAPPSSERIERILPRCANPTVLTTCYAVGYGGNGGGGFPSATRVMAPYGGNGGGGLPSATNLR